MALIDQFGKGWYEQLNHVFTQPWWNTLHSNVSNRFYYMRPEPGDLFRVFRETPYEDVKVVILSFEPYCSNHADGLAFSSRSDIIPDTLEIVYNELEREFGKKPDTGDLTHWANQGVLLLNVHLSVDYLSPSSHVEFGWLKFAIEVLKAVTKKPNTIIVAWGKPVINIADKFKDVANVIKGYHPLVENYSGDYLKFTGCSHFSIINQLLTQSKQKPILWIQS